MKKLFVVAIAAAAAYYFVKNQLDQKEDKEVEKMEEEVSDLEKSIDKLEEQVEENEKTEELSSEEPKDDEIKVESSEELDPEFTLKEEAKTPEEPAAEEETSADDFLNDDTAPLPQFQIHLEDDKENKDDQPSVESVLAEAEPEESMEAEEVSSDEEVPEFLKDEKSLTEKANETAMRLLNLQIDLVMANYPDDHIFLLQQSVEYNDADKLKELVDDYRTLGYVVSCNGHRVQLEKVILQKEQNIKEEILNLAKRVRIENEIYKGFNVIPQ